MNLTLDELAQLFEDLRAGVSDDPPMAECRRASEAMKVAAEVLTYFLRRDGWLIPTKDVEPREPLTPKQVADVVKRVALDKMVDRFLAWPLPDSVRSDTCVTMVGGDLYRSGTNLLTADEARQMLAHVLLGSASA